MNFNDFLNLTATQRTKLEEFRQIGLTIEQRGGPNVSTVNDQQAKQAANWINNELKALMIPTEEGVRYVRQLYKNAAAADYEDSVVPGP